MSPRAARALGVLASAALAGAYARGGLAWMLGFVAFVPWLRALDGERSLAGAAGSAWAMAVAYGAAVFAWFGAAVGDYAQWGEPAGVALLLALAPLFQPQFLAFALVRGLAGRRHGAAVRALAGAAAWVATEALVPRLLGDTFGHGLYPARLLRQAADLGGATGLTLVLLLANEAVAAALARRAGGWRAVAAPLALASALPFALAGYGLAVLGGASASPAAGGPTLRIGLVQANLVDYDRRLREQGAGAAVREILDTHFAMSWDAVERQHADAVLWSETVYPTTFGHPKSAAGAAFDREILDVVDAAKVPFVFGTYDRDAAGEYNAAAFVAPGTGLVGLYRKSRPFPLTESVPPWLDGPVLRRALPWAGTWRAGDGARVFPLRLADGREVPVVPLICLDDVDAGLAVAGARLGGQALLTLSNDAWFTEHPLGARLHESVAAFRSIETRLPQFRATANGFSGVIDATGEIVAGTRFGERTLVIGALPVREPPRTLMVAWGDWVGRAAAAGLALLAAASLLRRVRTVVAPVFPAAPPAPALPATMSVLPPAARAAAAALRVAACLGLLVLGLAIVAGIGIGVDADRWQVDTLARIRAFVAFVLAPEAAAWCVGRAFAARATLEGDALVLRRGARRLALPLAAIAAVQPWRVPLPGPGVALRLDDAGGGGIARRFGLAHPDPAALAAALAAAGAPLRPAAPSRGSAVAQSQSRGAAPHGRIAQPFAKFVVFPLLLALPAFRLHEHIAYGSGLGELYTFGLAATARAFAVWWAVWAIGVVLCAAALRAAIEAGIVATLLLRPTRVADARGWLERAGLAAFYLGVPGWVFYRVVMT